MDDQKRSLVGSKSRDAFRAWHKQVLSSTFYATDVDLVLVSKYPPKIVAAIDYKQRNDGITFSEVICYNDFLSKGIPVYIVQGEYYENKLPHFSTFTIFRYLGGDYRPEPPTVKMEIIESNIDLAGFSRWEAKLRSAPA